MASRLFGQDWSSGVVGGSPVHISAPVQPSGLSLWPSSLMSITGLGKLKSLRETETLALLSFFPLHYQLGTSGLQRGSWATRRAFPPSLGPSLCPAFMLASGTGSYDSCNSSCVTRCPECGVCVGLSPSELPVSLAPSAPQQTKPGTGALSTAELWKILSKQERGVITTHSDW